MPCCYNSKSNKINHEKMQHRHALYTTAHLSGLVQALQLAALRNICDNMVNIHFLQKLQFNITRLSFLKIK